MRKRLFTTFFAFIVAAVLFSCSKGEEQVISTYNDGKPKLVAYTKNIDGKKVLVYQRMFYQSGKVRFEGEMKNDQKFGVWKYFFESGDLFAQTDFTTNKAGEKWEVFTADNKPLVTANDTLITAALTSDNELVSISVRNQNLGTMYRFYESFKLREKWALSNNILNGQSMSYFENGNTQSIHHYADGLQDSTYVVFTESGSKLYSGQYKMGIKVGKWEYYNSDGSFARSEMYDNNGNKVE
ncbi:MAG: hypothetical protein LBO06_03075 [Bacteroidales bacterium]|jgi:antitoxin component YwqK of YwqJK toxin-antitoxin module|nr:hypothetical protein [Bacteroidales bacterium]